MTNVGDYLASIRKSLNAIEQGTDQHLPPGEDLGVSLAAIDQRAWAAALVFGSIDQSISDNKGDA